jgi:hypothetical protein
MSSERKKPGAFPEFDADKTSIDGKASDTKVDEVTANTAKIVTEGRSSLDDAFEARTVVTSRPSAIADDETSPGLAKHFVPPSSKPAAMPPLVSTSTSTSVPTPSTMKVSRPLPPMDEPMNAAPADLNSFDQIEEIQPKVNFFATRNGKVAAAIIGIIVFAVVLKSVMHREDAAPEQVKPQPVVEVPVKVQPKAPELPPPPPSTAAVLDQFDISFARTQAQAQK